MAPFSTAQLLVADGLNWDLMTGRVTAFNLLEEVQAPKVPALLPRLGVLVVYTFEEAPRGPFEERIRIVAPDQSEVSVSIASMKIVPGARHHNSLHNFAPLQFPLYGDYGIIAEYSDTPDKWVKTAQRRLIFSKAEPTKVSVASEP